MMIERIESAVNTDKLPPTVLRGLHLGKSVLGSMTDASWRGAGVLAIDPASERMLVIEPSYGEKLWHMPGGGVDETDIEDEALREFSAETGIDPSRVHKLEELCTSHSPIRSVVSKDKGNDTYTVFTAEVDGLVDYIYDLIDAVRQAKSRKDLPTSNEVARVWMPTPTELLNDGQSSHHALRKSAMILGGANARSSRILA